MPYVTVYEITQEAIPLWFPIAFVLFSVIVTVFLWETRGLLLMVLTLKPGRYLAVFLVCLWLAVPALAAFYFINRRQVVQAYRNGNYKIVEGSVKNYSWKYKTECFSVADKEFCHGTENQVGWEPPFGLGPASWPVGLIRDDLPVRVAYFDDNQYPVMLRLDFGGDFQWIRQACKRPICISQQ